MYKIGLVVAGMVLVSFAQAQNMARIVVSSCGATATNGTTKLDYTVGEAVVSYLTSNGSPTYKLSQGYQQSDTVAKPGDVQKVKTKTTNYVQISPNPASSVVKVSYFTEVPGALNYSIYNSFGQLCLFINKDNVLNGLNESNIDISKLAAGSYILQVSSANSEQFFVKNLPLIIVN